MVVGTIGGSVDRATDIAPRVGVAYNINIVFGGKQARSVLAVQGTMTYEFELPEGTGMTHVALGSIVVDGAGMIEEGGLVSIIVSFWK